MVPDSAFASLYVVIGIIFITWVGVVLYLIRLEKKVSRLEKHIQVRKTGDET